MSITAIVTNYNYAEYLPQCLLSCQTYCESVLVYDDASDDSSLEVIRSYGIEPVVNKKPSGGPVWGSNRGIRDCKTSHLVFVDADNYLVAKPPENDVDYTFADLLITNSGGFPTSLWQYDHRPTEPLDCLYYFMRTKEIPVPWGGVWRTEFIKSNHLKWRKWRTTRSAPDMRTAIEWLQYEPTISYQPKPFLAFRMHEGQLTDVGRDRLQEEACRLAPSIGATLRSRGYGG